MSEDLVSVRYMVDDVDAAVDFYTRHIDFELRSSAAPAFADVCGCSSPGRRARPDGRCPTVAPPVPAAGTESI